ncbi:MAG: hypothetical protein ACKVKR_07040, partial [Pseudomonadales bacterium]
IKLLLPYQEAIPGQLAQQLEFFRNLAFLIFQRMPFIPTLRGQAITFFGPLLLAKFKGALVQNLLAKRLA